MESGRTKAALQHNEASLTALSAVPFSARPSSSGTSLESLEVGLAIVLSPPAPPPLKLPLLICNHTLQAALPLRSAAASPQPIQPSIHPSITIHKSIAQQRRAATSSIPGLGQSQAFFL